MSSFEQTAAASDALMAVDETTLELRPVQTEQAPSKREKGAMIHLPREGH